MRDRHNSSVSRAALVAGAGVTGLIGLVVVPPAAHAAPTPSSDAAHPGATTSSPARTAKAAVAPSYGIQKYRVGVQVKDGSYVPPGTTTVGTVLTITETGPGVQNGSRTTTCTTDQSTVTTGSTASYCLGTAIAFARSRAATTNTPYTPSDVPSNQQFFALAGDTITITQKTVNANLLIDRSVGRIEPCTSTAFAGICTLPSSGQASPTVKGTSVVFNDPGLPPLAGNDSATTPENTPVTITIATNDTPKAPITGVAIAGDPKHGAARLVTTNGTDPSPSSSAGSSASASSSASDTSTPTPTPSTTTPTTTTSASTTTPAGTPTTLITLGLRRLEGSRSLGAVTSYRAIYTPNPGFVGTDTFTYAITTKNGSATAKVTVVVTGTGATTGGQSVDAAGGNRNGVASTGAPTGQLLGYAAALLVTGGGALALGRQRRRGRHAR